ncbi:MAG: hypothetical protein KKA32_13520 [Actinobacteria bacterium]|nr:hypothetical protein [Actinomycetota bacterium]
MEQLGNVGSEVERALRWAAKDEPGPSRETLWRGLELLDLTIADPKHRGRLRELTRLREVLLDYFLGENQYGSTADSWRRYFLAFGMAVALEKESTGRS